MRIIFSFLFLISIASESIGQGEADAMKKLDFLTGDWKGAGWYKMEQGQDSLVFSQKGEWIDGGKVLHISVAFQIYGTGDLMETVVDVSYDDKLKKYVAAAQAGTGPKSNGDGLLVDDHTFSYILTFGGGWKIRYSFTVTGNQQIVKGESANTNDIWSQMFGGTLSK